MEETNSDVEINERDESKRNIDKLFSELPIGDGLALYNLLISLKTTEPRVAGYYINRVLSHITNKKYSGPERKKIEKNEEEYKRICLQTNNFTNQEWGKLIQNASLIRVNLNTVPAPPDFNDKSNTTALIISNIIHEEVIPIMNNIFSGLPTTSSRDILDNGAADYRTLLWTEAMNKINSLASSTANNYGTKYHLLRDLNPR